MFSRKAVERIGAFVKAATLLSVDVGSNPFSTHTLDWWTTACKSGVPQLGILMHKWATARKSGRPRTSVCFENGFACQIRLRNTGPYE